MKYIQNLGYYICQNPTPTKYNLKFGWTKRFQINSIGIIQLHGEFLDNSITVKINKDIENSIVSQTR